MNRAAESTEPEERDCVECGDPTDIHAIVTSCSRCGNPVHTQVTNEDVVFYPGRDPVPLCKWMHEQDNCLTRS